MSFSLLRNLLTKQPSEELWGELCLFFEEQSSEELSLLLDYAQEHMKDWDPKLRHVESLKVNKRLPTYWPLVRSFSYRTKGKVAPKAFEKKPMSHILRLDINDCVNLTNYDFLENFPGLSYLNLHLLQPLGQGEIFEKLPKLTKLKISHFPTEIEMKLFSRLVGIEELEFFACYHLTSLRPLRYLTNLTSLKLGYLRSIEHFRDLSALSKLESLELEWFITAEKSVQFRALEKLGKLKHLKLVRYPSCDVRPSSSHMDTREKVLAFQRKIRATYKNR